MRVLFHPEFPQDVRRFEAEYARISAGLAARFRTEIDQTVDAIKCSPTSAGHPLNVEPAVFAGLRRRNVRAFPFFVLYCLAGDQLIFGSLIPTRSDLLTWLSRFHGQSGLSL
jgi:hypothetical protein